jgi:S-formylglutathione hydrolase FrmB
MRALLGILMLGLSGLLSPAGAGQLKHDTIYSASLKRDLPFLVYMPDGYDTSKYRYPVLYLLHGAGQDERAWASRGLIREKVDQLTEAGIIHPTIIVMPGCPRCWWIDGPKDKAESAFWKELVPAINSHYRTIETREGTLIAGLSAGGYGTVRFALRYPERIAAVAALSPAIYSETPPLKSGARIHPAFLDPAGRFDQKAWDRRNYPALLDGYFAQSSRVPMFLASGDNDRLGAAFETALLFKRMYQRQPRLVELRVVDGGHNWAVWAAVIDEAMRFLYRHASGPILDDKDPKVAEGSKLPPEPPTAISRASTFNGSVWSRANKAPLFYTPITQAR